MNKITDIPFKILYNHSKRIREGYKKAGFNSYEDSSIWAFNFIQSGLPWGTEIPIMGCVFFLMAGTLLYITGGIFHFKLNYFLINIGENPFVFFYVFLMLFSYLVPYKYLVYNQYEKYFEEFNKSEHKRKLFFKGFLLTILFWAYGISGMWFFGALH